jgi:segregation and condensation protein A
VEDRIIQLIVEQKEISWKSIIFDLVKTEQMNPWDVDLSILSQKYIERLKQYHQIDLKISGKVVLAAAILLRIKSTKLVGEDLDEFDRLLAPEPTQEEIYDSLTQELTKGEIFEHPELYPRTPQPRKRKVSVYDLVQALEKALEVKKRRIDRNVTIQIAMPEKKWDIIAAIDGIYNKIKQIFLSGTKLTFKSLLPSETKHDKIYTFIPLLHLANQQKIELEQPETFGEINIKIVATHKPAEN